MQQLAESKGTSNYPVETWTDLVADIWAFKEDVRGSERFVFAADQHTAPYDTRWELPYSTNWDPHLVNVPKNRRLVYEGRVHDIVAAAEIGRRRAVELLTVAGGLLE